MLKKFYRKYIQRRFEYSQAGQDIDFNKIKFIEWKKNNI
jgi:hypothetical protein